MSARPSRQQQQRSEEEGVKEFTDVFQSGTQPAAVEREREKEKKQVRTTTTTTTTTPPTPNDIVEQQTAAMLESPGWNKLRGEMNENAVETIRSLSPRNSYTIDVAGEPRTFTRNKIKALQYKELERLRTKMAVELKNRDPESNLTQLEIYQKCALYYLGITEEEFDECDFEMLKQVLDACTIRTTMGTASPN